jgi:hypothetical protein
MDSTALRNLRDKFVKEVKALKDELEKRQDKIRAIDVVLGALIEEGDNKASVQPPKGNTIRFQKMGPTEAIRKCINDPIRWWSVTEVKKTLLEGGFKTKSKNLPNIITSILKRFVKIGEVEIDKTAKPQKFKIKEKNLVEELGNNQVSNK